jgi:hypothetical protein
LACYIEILKIIKVARKDSSKLNGIAKIRIERGRTLIFHNTNHINTKAANHEINVVWIKLNFLEIININIENKSDQTPHIAPFNGDEGNSIPSNL